MNFWIGFVCGLAAFPAAIGILIVLFTRNVPAALTTDRGSER